MRWSSGLLASVVMIAALSGVVVLLEPHVPVLSLLVLYLLAVLVVAIFWGSRLAALTAVGSVAVFTLFLPPRGSLDIAEPRNLTALGVFLVTAVVVGELAARSRRTALESARLSREQSALRRVATLIAQSAPPSAVFEAVTREVGMLSGADLARMERYEADGTVTGVAAWSLVPVQLAVGTRFPLDGSSIARDVRRTRGPVRVETFRGATGAIAEEATALGIRSSVGCPIVVAGQLWGVIAASTRRDEPFPPDTESQIARFTELVATAVESAEAREELRRIAEEQAALRRVATLVARGMGPDLVFAAVAEEIGALLRADATALIRFEPNGEATFLGGHGWSTPSQPGTRFEPLPGFALASVRETGRAVRSGTEESMNLPKVIRQEGIRSAVDAPIVVEGHLWGAINIASRSGPLSPDTEQRIVEFTELIAMAIANADARAKLTQSRARIVATADATRRRIERDLHDGAQQRLVALALELRLAQQTVQAELPAFGDSIGQVAENLNGVLDELREISRGIHPAILSEGGLGPALRTLGRRSAVPVQLKVQSGSRYPPSVEVAAYYVVSEALTNTAKHANASQANLVVWEENGTVRLRVSDDGVGGAQPDEGTGLTGLRDRVEALGGSIDVTSPPGHGTVLDVSLPIEPTDSATSTGAGEVQG
ncbi:MAG TPA: GAF domain-containing protein [Propionibacteriaceae bacterium]|nr:GAF domain-containing protein [Propionibacteriaceae bacterium]